MPALGSGRPFARGVPPSGHGAGFPVRRTVARPVLAVIEGKLRRLPVLCNRGRGPSCRIDRSEPLAGVEQDRYRSFIDGFDAHPRTEDAGLDFQSFLAQPCHEFFV